MQAENLFCGNTLHDALISQRQRVTEEITSYPESKFLNTATEDLVKYVVDKWCVNPILLKKEGMVVDKREGELELGGRRSAFDSSSFYDDDEHPRSTPCTFALIDIPFTGDKSLFNLQPSTYDFSPPQAEVLSDRIRLHIPLLDRGEDGLAVAVKEQLARINIYIERQAGDIITYNNDLPNLARRHIQARKERLLSEQGLLASLGIPIRRRDGDAETYAPDVRRKILVAHPPASTAPYKPQPSLPMEVYEEILGVVQRMAEVMERSPSAFANLDEEDLRTHFLVSLNGAFETDSTGETFNLHGKADIFMKWDGGNVFVAECKFWSGEKAFGDIIKQLFGYTTWRDTKTAILFFSRNKDFSGVLSKSKDAAESHPHFKRTLSYGGANGFRGVYGHPDDMSREVIITTLAFDIPTN